MRSSTDARCRAFALVAVGALGGCAPSLEGLAAGRHFNQLVCSTMSYRGGDDANEPAVRAMLAEALDPRFHVAVLSEAEQATLLGPRAAELHARTLFARLSYDVHGSELREVRAELSFGPGLRKVEDAREGFASLTGERVAEAVTVDPNALEVLAHDLATGAHTTAKVGATFLRMLTLGLVPVDELVGDAPRAPVPRTFEPSLREHACAAPVAETLYQRLVTTERDCERGARCTRWAFYERPRDPDGAVRSEPLTLHLELVYEASAGYESCDAVREELDLPLPAGQPVGEAVAAIFGDRMRTLAELRALATAP